MVETLPWILLVLLVPPVGGAFLAVARTRSQLNWIASGCAVISLALILLLIAQVLAQGPISAASGLLYVDALSALVFLIVGLVGFPALLYSVDYMGRESSPHPTSLPRLRRYYAFVLLFLLTMYLVLEADNLGLLWIGLEATTLVSALLVAHYGTRRRRKLHGSTLSSAPSACVRTVRNAPVV
ncbi:Hydrogenase-4 component F, partial [mine drainage metagenome]